MKVQPYLFFDGRCQEAVDFYQSALGARVGALMRYGDAPPPDPAAGGCPGPAAQPHHVMHGEVHIGDVTVLVSDGMCGGKPEFKGMALTLNVADKAEGERLFARLAEGGQVQMPMGPTFFSPGFGMVADRFGMQWMVVTAQPA